MVYKSRRKNAAGCFLFDGWCQDKTATKIQFLSNYIFCAKKSQKKKKSMCKNNKGQMKFIFKKHRNYAT